MEKTKKKAGATMRRRNLFIASVITIPVINFLLFNIGNIVNMVVLAFEGYTPETGVYWNNFQNFADVFKDCTEPIMLTSLKNSLLFYAIGLIMLLVSLVISFYIYKKMPFAGFFRVLFVMPGMVTGMVWVRLFKYFIQSAVPEIFGLEYGWLTTTETIMPTLIGYGVWMGLAGNMIIFVGCMTGIDEELVEAGKVDGNSLLGEFWHIVLPQVYPIVQVTLVSGVIGIFMSGPPLFDFYNVYAHESLYTINYFLQVKVLSPGASTGEYAYSSAASVLLTVIVAPITFLVKWLTTKYGPSED